MRKPILIVEDDEATAELERRALTRSGMAVRVAGRVDAAVAMLREESFSAILLDYRLPDGDPWTIVEAAQASIPRIPVILVTAHGNERIASEAIRRGVDDYVKKADSFWERLPAVLARAQTLAEAEQSNAHLAAVVEASEDGIIGLSLNGTITSWSAGAERISGYSAEEVIGKDSAFLTPSSLVEERRGLLERLNRGESIHHIETRRVRKDGGEMHVSMSIAPIRDSSGKTVGVSTIVRDITEQKRREAQLERTMAQLAEAQEIAHLGSWEWDVAANTLTVSDELCRIFGIALGKFPPTYEGYLERVHKDDRAGVAQVIERYRDSGEAYSHDYRIVRPGGEIRDLHTRGRTTFGADKKAIRLTGIAEDVTDRKRWQARLLLSDRMASAGTLAAGVAHEINNPLAYVTGNLDLIAEEVREIAGSSPSTRLEALDEMVSEARQGAERVRKIVRGLMTFARADEERRVTLDVRAVLDLSINMTLNEVRHRARLVKDYGKVPPVRGDEARLGQVFINLLVNASHAIPEGHADRNEIRVSTRTDASGKAVVEIKDTGQGIPKEALGHIFDPFFTTKAVGEGTGLGLSICHGIVTALGGEIVAESDVGKGALFRVTLPTGRTESIPGMRAVSSKPAPTKRGRVLVVDDDVTVGKTLRRMLEGEHEVAVATSGAEALAIVGAGPAFDAILCDLMMPEMTGMDLYAALRTSSPESLDRIIFMTGGAFSPTARRFLDEVPNQRFEKPIDLHNLRASVRALVR